jgi:hypothetical protein
MASDTTQAAAKAAFLLAELYYFQLDKADSAVVLYREVEEDFPKSMFAPKSAYARLWISAYDRQDTLGAMALTDSIAERYHGTRHAESALYLWKRWSGRTDERTALLDSLLAHPDTSRYAAFEAEPELKLPAPVATSADTSAAALRAGAGSQMTAADSVRMEALRAARMRALEERGTPTGTQARPAGTAQTEQTQSADSSGSGSTAAPAPTTEQQAEPQPQQQEQQAAPPSSGSSESSQQQPSEDPSAQQPPQQTAPQDEEEEEDLEEDTGDAGGS